MLVAGTLGPSAASLSRAMPLAHPTTACPPRLPSASLALVCYFLHYTTLMLCAPLFNVQKHGGYALEHIFTHHPTSAKVFYLLLQLAHTLAQLIAHGSLLRQACPAGVGSAKNLAWRLLEAWRNARLTAQHIQLWLDTRVQIRFQPP